MYFSFYKIRKYLKKVYVIYHLSIFFPVPLVSVVNIVEYSFSTILRVHPPSGTVEFRPQKCHQSCPQRFSFEAQCDENLPLYNVRRVKAKIMNFVPKVGHCMVVQ